MHSQLHERLEYLVNFSSQLIFVSGDSIAQQQKTLEAFVFNQHDETDIAYLTAQPALELSDYRRQLCRQLLGQLVGSYVRPLNELLAELNTHNGPILITITQAEHLPDALLQELWDLVLQSRFASNKQHLNVLLFGQSAWAENAKQWLPAKNSDTPLLISSQSVMAEQGGTDLDRMIVKRREAFHEHLLKRQQLDNPVKTNRLASPWFWVSATLVFLVSFTALVAWQYGSDISALFQPLDSQPPQVEEPLALPGSAFSELTESAAAGTDSAAAGTDIAAAETNSAAAQLDSFPTSTAQADQPAITADNSDASDSIAGDTQPTRPASVSQDTPLSNNARVSSWAAQMDAWDKRPKEAQHNQTGNEMDTAAAPNQTPATRSAQVLPAALVKQAQQLSAQIAAAAPLPQNPPGPNTAPVQPMTTEPQVDNARLLQAVTAEDYVVQLAGLKDATLLRQFVSDYRLGEQVWIYRTQRYGGPWYVLLFKQPFASVAEARRAIPLLPDFPRKNEAFVKSGAQILAEISAQ